MRLLFALPGFHRYDRGAEVALLAVADACARAGDAVTVMGMGQPRPGTAYAFRHVPAIRRERFERLPAMPALRDDTAYEELSFAPGLLARFRPADYDATVTCAYPFTNWALRRPRWGARRPAHLFVTQNGDWPATSDASEFRWFGCDGLVCTNPDFYENTKDRWRAALIPNGVDLARFSPGSSDRARLGLPETAPVVLMVSALIDSKRVLDGIRAVARLPDAHLVVAGDGALRDEAAMLAAQLLPDRFRRITAPPADMPALYRSADVLLHMSLLEAFGNVFIEAMACGRPIVGHDTPRLRWIVGDAEALADTTDLDAVAAALARAMRPDPAARAARVVRAERFGWTRVAADYRAFLAELVI